MSPKQQRGEATAGLLLDAALRLYAAEGERGITVGAVTRASGVSLGSLYHHFGSIDGLVAALTQRWLGKLLSELLTALRSTRTARSGIRALVRAYLAFIQEHRDAALLLHSTVADRQAMAQGKELRDAQEARLSAFALWVQPHVESGELAPLPLPLIESLVLGPVVGVARRWLSGIDDVELDEAARVLPERIWRSVAP
ncbi:TetR/AcrR family transcriptional regulator [Streptomyces sp. WAC05374]|uniref:TetR/AcrR family transcriptional regulator n=1 Tax=Streptomyces sp. WAC05374 TaxID=2487420 RepID=UPI000F89D1C9|nr:TetR/AcrR family transcriptional regulator [Streptomyces sp. WAC05374]RST04022.1 TetR/AcrR family transcriptional regulator [Streptomyces sp. WAC05374]TDF54577.1 TetR/AcrR family transcriptional regulator [Streptomyces sp. WAC05374]TDF56212.1 TetR/AcrR family transcriptional regulator [Streptomyces sp. WAC05374]